MPAPNDTPPTHMQIFAVLYRDQFTCQHCGHQGVPGQDKDSVHVHHRIARSVGGTNDPENLETVCCRCHFGLDRELKTTAVRESIKRHAERRDNPIFTRADALELGDQQITVPEAAQLLGISQERMLQFCRSGRINAIKLGKQWIIRGADLALIAERRIGYPKGRPRKSPPPSVDE